MQKSTGGFDKFFGRSLCILFAAKLPFALFTKHNMLYNAQHIDKLYWGREL